MYSRWIVSGADDLSPVVADAVRDPANDVYLSAASSLEIAVKHARGRLSLPDAPERYVPDARTRHGIDLIAIDEECALHCARHRSWKPLRAQAESRAERLGLA